MIHLKSTLAISAIMLTGLVAASPFPYPSDHEPRKMRLAVEAAPETAAMTAWAEPPAKAQPPVEEPVTAAAIEMPAPVAEPVVAPAPVAAPPPIRHVSLQSPAQAKAEQARRRKLAKAARERQDAARQSAQGRTESQFASQTTPGTSQRIDPIGDILRGLGFGKEG